MIKFKGIVSNIFNFLNYRIIVKNNYSFILYYFSICSSSIIYTLFISYIIYNLLVLINPNPDSQNLLVQIDDIHNVNNINLTNQIKIFEGYKLYLKNLLSLNTGYIKGTYDSMILEILNSFSNTLFYLFSGILMSFLISCTLVLLNKLNYIKKNILIFICNISFIHISILLIIIENIFIYFFNSDINSSSYFLKLILSSIIVSFGSGILIDYFSLLNDDFNTIMKKDYVVFAKDSGFNEYKFASREIFFNLITITISRIPIIFGGLVIIEHYLKDSGMSGISSFLLESLNIGDTYSIFTSVIICIFFFTFLHILSKTIQSELIKN